MFGAYWIMFQIPKYLTNNLSIDTKIYFNLTPFKIYGIILPTIENRKAQMETSKPNWTDSEPGNGVSRGRINRPKILPEL